MNRIEMASKVRDFQPWTLRLRRFVRHGQPGRQKLSKASGNVGMLRQRHETALKTEGAHAEQGGGSSGGERLRSRKRRETVRELRFPRFCSRILCYQKCTVTLSGFPPSLNIHSDRHVCYMTLSHLGRPPKMWHFIFRCQVCQN
jgi:hypothetical protein